MAECSLDLIFFKIRDRPFVFLFGGQGLIFFQQLKLDFYRQSESIFFVIQLSTIAISPYTLVLTSDLSNKYISDQHS